MFPHCFCLVQIINVPILTSCVFGFVSHKAQCRTMCYLMKTPLLIEFKVHPWDSGRLPRAVTSYLMPAVRRFELIWKDWEKCAYQYKNNINNNNNNNNNNNSNNNALMLHINCCNFWLFSSFFWIRLILHGKSKSVCACVCACVKNTCLYELYLLGSKFSGFSR